MSFGKLLKHKRTARRNLPSYYSNKLTYNELLNAESKLGRTLFGPIPDGHHREFFESKKNVWIWHECFMDNLGKTHDITIRYEVRPNGVFKSKNGADYKKIDGTELDNLRKAAAAYLEIVKTKLYA